MTGRPSRITLQCVRCNNVLTAGPADPKRTVPVLCVPCQRKDPLLRGGAVKPKVRYWQDASGEWRYQLRAGNGEIIAQGEGHGTKADAERAFERVAELAPDATPEDDPPPEAA